MIRDIFRSAELQEQFIERGYVKIALPDPAVLETVKAEIAQLAPDDKFDPVANKVSPYAMQIHCTFFDTSVDYKRQAQELMQRYFQPVIDELMIDYSFISGNIFTKQPGEGMLHLHQNWAVADYRHTCVTLWIPMQDVDESNGTLRVVERSHKIVPYIPTPEVGDYFNQFTTELTEKQHLTPVNLKFGEAVIFCESIIHGSPVNPSSQPRTALQISFYPSECTPVVYKLDRESKVFNAHQIDTDFFINHSIEAVIQPTAEMSVIAQVPNLNKALSYGEFLFRMEKGNEHRAALYNNGSAEQEPFISNPRSPEVISQPESAPWGWRRLISFFRS